MLNIFPEFLTYSMLAPFILRVVLGFIFVNLGYLELTREKYRWARACEALGLKPGMMWSQVFGITQIVGGLMLIAGLFTQGAALFFAFISLAELYVENRAPLLLKRNLAFYLLIFAISLSLIFSGAGFLAFDLPL